jgi:hypothetical protein
MKNETIKGSSFPFRDKPPLFFNNKVNLLTTHFIDKIIFEKSRILQIEDSDRLILSHLVIMIFSYYPKLLISKYHINPPFNSPYQ